MEGAVYWGAAFIIVARAGNWFLSGLGCLPSSPGGGGAAGLHHGALGYGYEGLGIAA